MRSSPRRSQRTIRPPERLADFLTGGLFGSAQRGPGPNQLAGPQVQQDTGHAGVEGDGHYDSEGGESDSDTQDEEEEGDHWQAGPALTVPVPVLAPLVQGEQGQGQVPGVREVAGILPEQALLEELLDPAVPGPHPGPVVEDTDGWNVIDKWGVWQCALCEFPTLQDIPSRYRHIWAK